ncbi:hypothetical protein [Paenirhodobacter sp.]|uniref:hypothetical protein n=1 Tax=Paenirhodobacter sp. TaxID=1965326 RepID=UPI003B3C9FF7
MSKKTTETTTDTTGGVHYHYHFYGANVQPPQQAGPSGGFSCPQPPQFPPTHATEPNPHAHPSADSLVKGLAVGAGAAWLLTSEPAQRVVMRTAVQLWAALQGGIEELKERYHDAEAEAAAETVAEPEPPAPEPKRRSGPRPVKA